MDKICSIVMFCFCAGLLVYAAKLAVGKRLGDIPKSGFARIKDGRKYTVQFAKLTALIAAAPAAGGVIGLFDNEEHSFVLPAVICCVVLMIVFLVIGIKVFMKDADK